MHHYGVTRQVLLSRRRLKQMLLQRHWLNERWVRARQKGAWDKAFGINGPGQFDITYYQNTGIRPATFLGYDRHTYYAVGGPVNRDGVLYDDTIAWQAGGFILNFLFYWDAAENDLSYAINNAKRNLPPIYSWYPGDGLQIIGYPYLHVDEFTRKTDWQ
jgi:hypothetical protein